MPKYVIEREIPGPAKCHRRSCRQCRKLLAECCGRWAEHSVAAELRTGDKIYCVYIAPNEEMIREHAQQGGFPANRVSEIKSIIDPTTAEA